MTEKLVDAILHPLIPRGTVVGSHNPPRQKSAVIARIEKGRPLNRLILVELDTE